MFAAFPDVEYLPDSSSHIGHDGQIHMNSLVDRAAVNIDVYLLAIRRKSVKPSGHPVVKTCAQTDHHIALVHRHIGFISAVHTQHTEPRIARRRIGAKPHQR